MNSRERLFTNSCDCVFGRAVIASGVVEPLSMESESCVTELYCHFVPVGAFSGAKKEVWPGLIAFI